MTISIAQALAKHSFGWTCALALAGTNAFAQSQPPTAPTAKLPTSPAPSQVEPTLVNPPPPPPANGRDSGFDATPIGHEVPPGADKLVVRLRSVTLDNADLPPIAEAEAALREEVLDHPVTLADLYAAADRLEAAYARAGYVLVRVIVPPQTITNWGTLRLQVIDGFIEAIDTQRVPTTMRGFVRARLMPLVGQHHLRLANIERRMLLAGDAAGLTLRSALRAGKQAGGTELVVEGHYQPINVTLSTDNNLPAALGYQAITANLALNGLAGQGEQLTVTGAQQSNLTRLGFGRSPYATAGAGLVLPLLHDGLTFSANYLHSRTLNATRPAYFDTLGEFSRLSATLQDYLVINHSGRLQASAGVDVTAQSQRLPFFGWMLSRDAYAALRLDLNGWCALDNGGTVTGDLRLSQGLRGRAPPGAHGIGFSRMDAHDRFTRLDGHASWRTNLTRNTDLALILQAQTAFGEAEFVPEQIALAGAQAIGGTPPGQLTFDTGATARGELSHTIVVHPEWGDVVLAPYGFASEGVGWLSHPSAVEKPMINVGSLGGGLRLNGAIGGERTTLSLEFGRCLCRRALGADTRRVTVSFSIAY